MCICAAHVCVSGGMREFRFFAYLMNNSLEERLFSKSSFRNSRLNQEVKLLIKNVWLKKSNSQMVANLVIFDTSMNFYDRQLSNMKS